VNRVQGDLLDQKSLISAFQNQEVLINLAAEVRNDALLEKTNVVGTRNILIAIAQSSIQKVIHLSSVGVLGMGYSNVPKNVKEDDTATPDNEYERTKNISEELFLAEAKKEKFELTVLRPTNVFGEEHPFKALLNMFKHAKANNPLLYSSGAQVNYLYVGDLAACLIHFIAVEEQCEIYHVGSSMPLEKFYKLIKGELPSNAKSIRIPSLLVKLASRIGIHKLNAISNQVKYNDDKLKRVFTYPFDIEKGIKNTINFFKAQNEL